MSARTTTMGARALALAGAVAIGAAMCVGFAGDEARANQNNTGRFEFAELVLLGNDAVLFTSGGSFFLQGPERNEPQPVEGEPKYRFQNSMAALHLTTMGQSGWDVVCPTGDGTRPTYLLRRTR